MKRRMQMHPSFQRVKEPANRQKAASSKERERKP